MKFASLSDIHIKIPNDISCHLLNSFLNSKEVNQSQSVYLLGDIFDFCIGNHDNHILKYKDIFENLKSKTIDSGKHLYFIEGNHDFHISEILINYFDSELFHYADEGFVEYIDNKKFLFTHGHELDRNNSAYNRWRSIYKSKAMKILVDKILPYSLVNSLSAKASANSKKRGKQVFNYEILKEIYLTNAKEILQEQNLDFLIAGHTHIQENITWGNSQYVNNGYPQHTKKFIFYNGTVVDLISL